MKLVNMNSGKSLRQLMSRDSVSRSEMAEALKCTESYVSAMRKNKSISAGKLIEVCDFFKVSASEYFKLGETEEGK